MVKKNGLTDNHWCLMLLVEASGEGWQSEILSNLELALAIWSWPGEGIHDSRYKLSYEATYYAF